MNFPSIHMDHMNIKVWLGQLKLNILYVKFGYFYQSIQKHTHSNKSYELHFVPHGQGTLIANGVSYPINTNTLFMTGPGIAHEQITNPEAPMAEYCICFEILRENDNPKSRSSNEEQDYFKIAERLIHTNFWIGQDCQDMLPLFLQLAEETSLQYIGYFKMVQRIIEQLIIKLIRNYTSNQRSIHPIPLKTLDDNRLVIIENCFLGNYANVTLKDLATRLGLSIRQTERTIKNRYGITFSQKRTEARMSAAAYYLTTTKRSISDITQLVGFATPEHFCQTFKKIHMQTPSSYRKSYCNSL